MTKLNLLLTLMIFVISTVLSQSDITRDTKLNMSNDWGKKTGENTYNYGTTEKSKIPGYLLKQYADAKLRRDQIEKARIGEEIQKYLEQSVVAPEGSYTPTIVTDKGEQPPFNPDWYINDVQVYTGNVGTNGSTGFRQFDLKYGEDGWLYLAVNRRSVSGSNGAFSVYRSSNGGAAWALVGSASNSAAYFGNLTMLVEKRHASNNDSVRVLVFYNRSNSNIFNDASIEMVSWRRDGAAAYVIAVASPPAGHKFEYPSACSDGMYWDVATYMHLIFREVSNDGNTYYGMRHLLSLNWGTSYSSVLINTGNNDNYPSAAYCEKGTGDDSIYIAVERRITTTEYEVRAIITCEWLTTNHFVYFITSATSGTKYERPCITVQQQQASVPRRVMITCTKNNIARYHISTNGGGTWMVDGALGTNGLADYTWCNSDSLTAGDGYAVACFVDQNGDSVTVRRGNITGSLGPYHYKRNSNPSSGVLAPVCAIYKEGTSKYAAFAYAGFGPTNLFFNSEQLITGITPISNIAERFELSQNYPNPFNPATNITFSIPKTGMVKLAVYDVMGKEIGILVNDVLNHGIYNVDFDGSGLASGVYLYKMTSGGFTDVKKMLMVK